MPTMASVPMKASVPIRQGGRLPSFRQRHGSWADFSDDYADFSVRRVKLDPKALIQKRYCDETHSGHWRPNGNISIRHLEYRAEKWRSVRLDCTPLLSV
jgi:hypothetical protein